MDHLKWKSSPRPGGNTEEVLLALASCNVYLHLPEQRLPFKHCQGLPKLLKCIFGSLFKVPVCRDHYSAWRLPRYSEIRKSIPNTWEGLVPCEMNAHRRCKKISWIWLLLFLLSLLSYDSLHIFQLLRNTCLPNRLLQGNIKSKVSNTVLGTHRLFVVFQFPSCPRENPSHWATITVSAQQHILHQKVINQNTWLVAFNGSASFHSSAKCLLQINVSWHKEGVFSAKIFNLQLSCDW